jgi:uncharacterized membrane protein YgcG
MTAANRTSRARQQEGQALVAVIVLIALLFLVGTAMTLAVSSSLQTVRQTADEDWRGYAAESAVTRDLANAADVTPASQPPVCTGPTPLGAKVNGFAMSAKRCAVLQVDGTSMSRTAIAAQKVGGGSCATPAVAVSVGRKSWGAIAWLRPGNNPNFDPNLRVFLDGQDPCAPSGSGTTNCTVSESISVAVAYFSCPDDESNPRELHVTVQNALGARLSAFYVRSADEFVPGGGGGGGDTDGGGGGGGGGGNGNGGGGAAVSAAASGGGTSDCVVTSIGLANGAINEGDLVKPSCGTANTSVAFWNKLLP